MLKWTPHSVHFLRIHGLINASFIKKRRLIEKKLMKVKVSLLFMIKFLYNVYSYVYIA